MGRPKKFNREEVLEKAMPLFWKQGFANTGLQDLEKATGVNKSGLYSEFKDKEDLFLASLRYYYENSSARNILATEPLGWSNLEKFFKLMAQPCTGEQKGCLGVNSMPELGQLGGEAKAISSPWNFLRARKAALRLMALGNSRRRKKPVQPAKVSDEKVFDYAGNL